MTVPRVKICGITRIEDGLAAANAGADAIGLVFYGPSPRAVTARQAAEICASLPPFVTTVALFVDASRAEIEGVLARVPVDLLQFHGNENPQFCDSFNRPWIKAVRMKDDVDLHHYAQIYRNAAGLLIDSYVAGVPGGTGETFNWGRVPKTLPLPVVLAGGLHPGNVAAAVTQVQPWAVDVSGGVEQKNVQGGRSGGIKDASAIRVFINSVKTRGVAGV
ncbi:MAG: N-(5'-phosphoribosyl)anthranilate isomerase [Alcanivorax borkumensis]|jgi:phosphoribosylanthranilate isomerase|uniref:N-(5'-phosphoribosyl)anthranilate isomerase n=1 Tax=Alcanivorax borkumensis (strain ATCC 700651 / DSM 11573 / NCIMB 13689 / SK2) TaxID=393595 RepID=TRPF_ALCBS|nr:MULTISPECIES: phosphoribosylanthranilate isomerase [Alcanivorax]Q0VPI8.1 RecName: Full=N-(5'-phosphoribosyl)anthranilate isomerase; Short=PRAI [Alcanivorax borkumensis SK2]OJH08985.1 MAG: N-(5'-phosphoribosyl)anthranilate isomerase [Alcanivorax borkumensis]EUC70480.1 N-(5'-phosphoribosyl)anthranilate isomerase [Alcanivorax sp. 97CO-5]PKG02142.1 phosphoribosylanthranilate isomerase [Alcanivorax sp. 97CO-6]CAL16910.1 N-(5'-phosphoribosyl)anthranilate isomerase [Alcanivorax borkumensis SK2]BA